MKMIHTLVMNTQRITISMPNYLYEQLLALAGKGNVSGFVTEATEAKILNKAVAAKNDPVDAFFALRKIAPRRTNKQILEAIRKGRE